MKIKNLTILLFTVFFLNAFVNSTHAYEIISRENIKLDETLSEEMDIYSAPQKIYVSQLEGFSKELNNDTQEWIKLLHYYSITRLKLKDIPYNYLIDQSGNIYEGAKGGIGVNPGLEGGENIILIGIMDSSSNLSPRTSTVLKEFVENLSYMYGIKEGNWEFVDLKLKAEESFSYLIPNTSKKALLVSLKNTFDEIKWSDTEHLEYESSIVSVEYEKEVEIGKRLKVSVTIKNENDFAWFGSPNYIYLSTKDSVESKHAINSVWESFSKPTYIQDGVVKPKNTTVVEFELQAKSIPGSYKEEFFFMKSADIVVEGSSFDVEFSIVKGNNRIVQIVSPQYGFVNIRECRWYSCKKVEVATEGDVFVFTKKEEGWYEIIYQEGIKGWISQTYAKEI